MQFDWSVIADAMPALLNGARLTILITVVGLAAMVAAMYVSGTVYLGADSVTGAPSCDADNSHGYLRGHQGQGGLTHASLAAQNHHASVTQSGFEGFQQFLATHEALR